MSGSRVAAAVTVLVAFLAKQKPLFNASAPVHLRIRGFTWHRSAIPARFSRNKALGREEIRGLPRRISPLVQLVSSPRDRTVGPILAASSPPARVDRNIGCVCTGIDELR